MVKHLLLPLIFAFLLCGTAQAVPGVSGYESTILDEGVEGKGLEELIAEAQILFSAQKPIDARSRLVKALEVAPKDYRPHLMLGAYYLTQVGHHQLALRYVRTAQELFEEKFGSDLDGSLDPREWRTNAHILHLLAETRLNLDNYEGALATLDRFAKNYWDDWYPGTRAWVLFKLKRLEEAIEIAQAGLLTKAEPGRVYNILGILLSVKENKKLSLEAFSNAIKIERALGTLGQAATPLNNAGEVYRELFSDELAEASWLKALQLPDGCEHILPSLNLAILYTDELRLFQAERSLEDFEVCFAANPVRSDSEHRSLMALQRGRIALREGDLELALRFLKQANERQQWFGKIGTDLDDFRLAATTALADALRAEASVLETQFERSLSQRLWNLGRAKFQRAQAWWLYRKARAIAVDKLGNFEDLMLRNTDTMIEYPTLGNLLAGFSEGSLRSRLSRLQHQDNRLIAKAYYDTYLGTLLYEHGDYEEAEKALERAYRKYRDIDRLVTAETLAKLILTKEKLHRGWLSDVDSKQTTRIRELKYLLLHTLPSHVRYHQIKLPVAVSVTAQDSLGEDVTERALDALLGSYFEESAQDPAYTLNLSAEPSKGKGVLVRVALVQNSSGAVFGRFGKVVTEDFDGMEELLGGFSAKIFSHKADPPSKPLPTLSLDEGLPL